MDHREAPSRPTVYRRVADRGPWMLAIRRLYENRWPDSRIAETLCDLSAEAIARLEAGNLWNWRDVEAAQVPGAGGSWSRWQVWYYRQQAIGRCPDCAGKSHGVIDDPTGTTHWTCPRCKGEGIATEMPGNPQPHECGSLMTTRATRWHKYQCKAGWVHLLPRYDEKAGQWLPGLVLRPRECQILSLLRDRGPMTRRELSAALRLAKARHCLRSGSVSYLGRLLGLGLVVIVGFVVKGRKVLPRYGLAEVVAAKTRRRLATSVDRGYSRLARDLAAAVE